ncbi:oligopeptidase B [Flavobacteriaceae bacterium UJ101]|nr:oligopeptidase B [Flavobacteriaceae bacterium UJ101]
MKKHLIFSLSLVLLIHCNEKNMNSNTKTLIAPKAKTILHKITTHGHTRTDPYYWMNDRENPEVIDYLNQENNYLRNTLQHTDSFQKILFEEMKGRIKEDDESVPYKLNGYWYKVRYEKGQEYPIYTRFKDSLTNKEHIMFNANEMAEGHSFFNLGGIKISENNQLAAFSTDTLGRRIYTLQFKNLETGEILPDTIENTTGSATWASDDKTVFYTRKDESLRAFQIYKHILGTDSSQDVLVFHEKDETFNVGVHKTKSREFIMISSHNTVSDEYRFIKADEPNTEFTLIQPRERDLEYSVEHYNNHFYIITNKDGATNFKIMKTSIDRPSKENWLDIIPHREDAYIEDIEIYNDYLVVEERSNGLVKFNIKKWDGSEDYYMDFPEETYSAYIGFNPDFNATSLRYGYNSMTTPSSIIEYNLTNKSKKVLKEQEVLDPNFNKENYISERIWATAKDGKKVALSIVRRKDTPLGKDTPLLLYAYGSYGHTIDPYFSTVRLSLLDRGFVYALAHIRGSQYLGREWYEEGKMLKKMNTFTDFIACGEHLVQQNYTSPEHLYAMGGSAGGLLMGAVMNLKPELFHGVVAQVPFVDVVTTMLDESIPLTTGEFDEWGNPKNKEYYEYMLQYSPYDNVEAKNYPNTLVMSGLHDSQVQYWEPTKWVAKLRSLKTDQNKTLLHTNMDAGHGGASGRFESLKEVALEYAFLLDLENIHK